MLSMFVTPYFLTLYAASALSILIFISTKKEDDKGTTNVGWPGKFVSMVVLGFTIGSVSFQLYDIWFYDYVGWSVIFLGSASTGLIGVIALANGINFLRRQIKL